MGNICTEAKNKSSINAYSTQTSTSETANASTLGTANANIVESGNLGGQQQVNIHEQGFRFDKQDDRIVSIYSMTVGKAKNIYFELNNNRILVYSPGENYELLGLMREINIYFDIVGSYSVDIPVQLKSFTGELETSGLSISGKEDLYMRLQDLKNNYMLQYSDIQTVLTPEVISNTLSRPKKEDSNIECNYPHAVPMTPRGAE